MPLSVHNNTSQTNMHHPRIREFHIDFQYTDMKEDMRVEAVDAVVSAIEKFGPSKGYDSAAKMVKELMDKKFSPSWCCFIGEGFGFEVDAEKFSMLYMYYGGAFGILLYKNPF